MKITAEQRKKLRERLLANDYSEESTSVIVNTVCMGKIPKYWDTLTKYIIKQVIKQ